MSIKNKAIAVAVGIGLLVLVFMKRGTIGQAVLGGAAGSLTGINKPWEIWGVDTLKKSRGLDSLRGGHTWPMNWKSQILQPGIVTAFRDAFPPTGALFQLKGNPIASMVDAGQDGRWTPDPTVLVNGTPGREIKLDVRAGYVLSILCKEGDVKSINHLGAAVLYNGKVTRPGQQEYGHGYGYAIDLTDDDAMNKIVTAAKTLYCPIGWISAYKSSDGTWPIFQLRADKNGTMQKVQVGSTKSNHSNPHHYHLMLPRPDWALSYVDAIQV